MDPLAPRGLIPAGPGATGSPLVDWVLSDENLAGEVLLHLTPLDMLALRAACCATRNVVTGSYWQAELSWLVHHDYACGVSSWAALDVGNDASPPGSLWCCGTQPGATNPHSLIAT